MKNVYTAEEIAALAGGGGKQVQLGVIGNPIAHSKSPQMQQAALASRGIAGSYIRVESPLEEGGFAATLAALDAAGFTGCNVTVPFKTQAFAAAVQRDALCELCGAVNTLKKEADGWHAYNTDGPGFSQAVRELCGKSLSELRVVILGACGGAGSALACQCALEKCPSLVLVNRPKRALHERTAQLRGIAGEESVRALTFESRGLRAAVEAADLIVNATSLGLKEGDALPLPAEWLRPGQAVYDIVTHETPFRQAAEAAGCKADNGLSMLLWQGAYAFEHWFGTLPSVAAMREALLHA